MTTPRKHRSPSKDRYAKTHPAVTVHFDLDTYNRLVSLRKATDLSLNQLVRAALDSLEAEVADILDRGWRQGVADGKRVGEAAGRQAGYAEGYLKAKARFRLTYPCGVCRKPVEVVAGHSDAARAIAALVEGKWMHGECNET
jgi:flagellar biosynthesis/type III secretory pathway protein FliH